MAEAGRRPVPLLLALLITAGSAGAEERLACRGNEPFWSLEIGDRSATYATPGEAPAELRGEMRRFDPLGIRVWRGRAAGDARDWVAFVDSETCADTMADQSFPMRALVSRPDGSLLAGCCGEPVPAAEAKDSATDWSARLMDFLPAIETCLAASNGPMVVTKAWPLNRGLVGVRLLDPERRRFDCLAPHAGGAPVAYSAIEGDGTRLPGEFQPLFTPNPGQPPAGECYQHQQVFHPTTGAALGWLSYDTC